MVSRGSNSEATSFVELETSGFDLAEYQALSNTRGTLARSLERISHLGLKQNSQFREAASGEKAELDDVLSALLQDRRESERVRHYKVGAGQERLHSPAVSQSRRSACRAIGRVCGYDRAGEAKEYFALGDDPDRNGAPQAEHRLQDVVERRETDRDNRRKGQQGFHGSGMVRQNGDHAAARSPRIAEVARRRLCTSAPRRRLSPQSRGRRPRSSPSKGQPLERTWAFSCPSRRLRPAVFPEGRDPARWRLKRLRGAPHHYSFERWKRMPSRARETHRIERKLRRHGGAQHCRPFAGRGTPATRCCYEWTTGAPGYEPREGERQP